MSPHPALFSALLLSGLLLSCVTDGKDKPPVNPNPDDTTGTYEPGDPPGAPSGVVAIAADARATLSWTPPENAAASKVTRYRVFAQGETQRQCSVSAPATTCTVTGLTNKKTYTFIVHAENKNGLSEPSRPSLTVVPLPPTLPAPQGLTATAGSGTATVSWTSPPPGTWVSVSATQDPSLSCKSDSASSCTITGLVFGKAYAFTARAHGEVGASAPTSPTAPVYSLPTPPGAPSFVGAAAGDTQATVSWLPPSNNGGDSILVYEVSSLNTTGIGCKTSASERQCVVGKLPANVQVIFRVRAVNAQGPGASAATIGVTPFFVTKVPGPPTGTNAAPGNGEVTVSWSPPALSGAAPVLRYRVTTLNSEARCATTGLTCTVKGLTNGRSHTFHLTAINSYGEGNAVLLYATPTAP